jgi:hypothetical protein
VSSVDGLTSAPWRGPPRFTSPENPTTAPPPLVLKPRRAAGTLLLALKQKKPSPKARTPRAEIPPPLRLLLLSKPSSSPPSSREFAVRSPDSERQRGLLRHEAESCSGRRAFRRFRSLKAPDSGRCRSGLRRACGYRRGGAGSGWVPATGSGSWSRSLLRTFEVSVRSCCARGEP